MPPSKCLYSDFLVDGLVIKYLSLRANYGEGGSWMMQGIVVQLCILSDPMKARNLSIKAEVLEN